MLFSSGSAIKTALAVFVLAIVTSTAFTLEHCFSKNRDMFDSELPALARNGSIF